MTTFEQALHIFRKDARHLRWELGGLLFLLVLLVLTGVETWEGLQEHGGPGSNEGVLSVLLPVAWAVLIARAIQTEALPGDRHFWLTRPYSRAGLVLSKALFIGAFITLPFLLAQALIVLLDGLPLLSYLGGLLWNQLLLIVLLLLPAAAIASLTRNLAQFLPAALFTTGIMAPIVFEHRSLGDMEWIRSSLGFAVVLAIVCFALWRQYRLRRTVNATLLTLGATFAGVILYLSFPPNFAFALQSRLLGTRSGAFALRLGSAAPRPADTKTANRFRQLVALPLAITGADPRDLRIKSSRFTFKTLAGITRQTSGRVELKQEKLWHTASLDREFFDAAKDSPVNIRAEMSLTLYGNPRTAEVPLDGTPVNIPGPGQCGVAAGYDHRRFVCRSAFTSPKPFLSERLKREDGDNRWYDVYSPFPSQLRIYPVVTHTYQFLGKQELAPAEPERPALLLVRDPVAYFRYTMDAPSVRLRDFAVTDPKEEEEN